MEPKSTILIVDDNPDKLGLLEAAFSLAGYNVNTATAAWIHGLLQRSSAVSFGKLVDGSAARSKLPDQSLLHGGVDRFAGDESELNTGGPT